MPFGKITYGLNGSGCNVEFKIEHQTEKAYLLKDEKGFEFWLPKSLVKDDGEFTDKGVELTQEKYRGFEHE